MALRMSMSSRLRQPSFLARTITGTRRWFRASARRRSTLTRNDTLVAFVIWSVFGTLYEFTDVPRPVSGSTSAAVCSPSISQRYCFR
ncbi:hypothetical protein BDP55DRAFT_731753 [Colletotrichum godetiae]|uniref:Uncharacterized protein n=1 Tax=Colletotrichum godetiae TaxID=1209918 RepID=A0AAJ0AEZ0_9PEZI|nr:uncharacterized protein BDP55DRAFT_731753 [Colletotrichum godetiae]KAK1672065.1 hypothetical protein BDP55DRAFT_731753 [Colletotrichum godetiae]